MTTRLHNNPASAVGGRERRIALIGCGALARQFIDRIAAEPGIRISNVLVRPGRVKEVQRTLSSAICIVDSLEAIDHDADLVLELASHSAVATHVPHALELGIDVAIASTGALADDSVRERLSNSAEVGGSQLHILTGAVGAIDALSAHREGNLRHVLYTGTKPPVAWRDTSAAHNFELDRIKSALTIFEGSAREAALLYPKNANVAATIALAGLGFDRTRVRLVADPAASENVHRIEASSSAGGFVIELTGKPVFGNPRTSLLTALSAVRTARDLLRPIVV